MSAWVELEAEGLGVEVRGVGGGRTKRRRGSDGLQTQNGTESRDEK